MNDCQEMLGHFLPLQKEKHINRFQITFRFLKICCKRTDLHYIQYTGTVLVLGNKNQ